MLDKNRTYAFRDFERSVLDTITAFFERNLRVCLHVVLQLFLLLFIYFFWEGWGKNLKLVFHVYMFLSQAVVVYI